MDLALTVDVEARDHPCREGNFRAMVDTLVRAGAPATLFVQGRWAEGRATDDEVAALGEPGMVVGLHGHTHRPFSGLTEPEVADEMTRSEAALVARDVEPVRPLFRFPYLDGNTDAVLRAQLHALGWEHVDCHAIAYDWLFELRDDPAQVAQHAMNGIAERRRAGAASAIVLLHSWPDPTPGAVELLLDHASRNGDGFVTVLDVPHADWEPPGQ